MVNKRALKQSVYDAIESSICCDHRVSIYDLGIVDRVDLDDHGNVDIKVIPCCPFGMTRMVNSIKQSVSRVDGIKEVKVEVTLDKVWTPDRLSDRAKQLVVIDLKSLAKKQGIKPKGLKQGL